MSVLLRNLLHFGRLLTALGLDVPPTRMLDVATALEYVDIGRRSDFYFTLRSLLVHDQKDLAVFDEAFHAFWRRPAGDSTDRDLRALGEKRRFAPPEQHPPEAEPGESASHSPALPPELVHRVAPLSYSPREVPRTKDFAAFTEEEIAQAKAMLASLAWDLGERRTRRWTAGRGTKPHARLIVRRNLRYGGEPRVIPTRDRTWKRRRLVLLCDVSGSMERYARMLVHFVHSLTRRPDEVETFFFATRLTRVTRELRRQPGEEGVARVPRLVRDWGGGTRIGEALRTLNVKWAKRVLGHGPVVLLISDGWDRGNPDLLQREMARLQRSCYRLIWLNPLLGSPDYQPLTRGMRAALPFVDDFLPVHNLDSLLALADRLNRLPARRGVRRSRLSPTPA